MPHDADWTYSLAFPPGHEWHSLKAEESYRRVHEWIQGLRKINVKQNSRRAARSHPSTRSSRSESGRGSSKIGDRKSVEQVRVSLRRLLQASALRHEKFDVLWHGKKIAGAAQRRNKLGLLIQGSVQSRCLGFLSPPDWQKAMCDVGRVEFGAGVVGFCAGPDVAGRAELSGPAEIFATGIYKRR